MSTITVRRMIEVTITWRRCEDGIPDDGETVLIATDEVYVDVGWHDECEWHDQRDMPIPQGIEVTHWAYFPPHPEYDR